MRNLTPVIMIGLTLATLPATSHAFGSRRVEQPTGIDGGSPGDPTCVIRSDHFSVHLSAYQNLNESSLASHCQQLPQTGHTHLVLDLHSANGKIRHVPLQVRVIAESRAEAGFKDDVLADPERTLTRLQPQTYKTGVVELDTDFDQPGKYALLVEGPQGDNNYTLRIPLQVALQARDLSLYIALAAASTMGTGLWAVIRRHYRQSSHQ